MGAEAHWYAFKVFSGKVFDLKADLDRAGVEYYYPVQPDGKPYVQSLIFIRCSESQIVSYIIETSKIVSCGKK